MSTTLPYSQRFQSKAAVGFYACRQVAPDAYLTIVWRFPARLLLPFCIGTMFRCSPVPTGP